MRPRPQEPRLSGSEATSQILRLEPQYLIPHSMLPFLLARLQRTIMLLSTRCSTCRKATFLQRHTSDSTGEELQETTPKRVTTSTTIRVKLRYSSIRRAIKRFPAEAPRSPQEVPRLDVVQTTIASMFRSTWDST